MKKILLLTFIFILCLSVNVFATDNISLMVNGAYIQMDVNPIIKDGRTLVPVRVVEQLGIPVSWDGTTKTVRLGTTAEYIDIQIDNFNVTKFQNGVKRYTILEVPPIIYNDRTMVPIRFISENFGYVVNWDDATRTVSISSNGSAIVTPPVQKPIETPPIKNNINYKLLEFLEKPIRERKIHEEINRLDGFSYIDFYNNQFNITTTVYATKEEFKIDFNKLTQTCSFNSNGIITDCSKSINPITYSMLLTDLEDHLSSQETLINSFKEALLYTEIFANEERVYVTDSVRYFVSTDENGEILSLKIIMTGGTKEEFKGMTSTLTISN